MEACLHRPFFREIVLRFSSSEVFDQNYGFHLQQICNEMFGIGNDPPEPPTPLRKFSKNSSIQTLSKSSFELQIRASLFTVLDIFSLKTEQNRARNFSGLDLAFCKSYKLRGLACCRQEIPNGFGEGAEGRELKSEILKISAIHSNFLHAFGQKLLA